jgi:hypothetical protein
VQSGSIPGDSSIPLIVQNDMMFWMLGTPKKFRLSGICRDVPPAAGQIANPTYFAPLDVLGCHGDSQ